jgi:hypothetical protein
MSISGRKSALIASVVAVALVVTATVVRAGPPVRQSLTTSDPCSPADAMPIVGCIRGEADRQKATGGWRIDPDMVVWIR